MRLPTPGDHISRSRSAGHNLIDKPAGVKLHRDRLAADASPRNAFDATQFSDCRPRLGCWGWWWVRTHRIYSKVSFVLNAPHPSIWLKTAMDHDPEQRRPEPIRRCAAVGCCRNAYPHGKFKASKSRLGFQRATVGRRNSPAIGEAWRQPVSLTAMINWYRRYLVRPFVSHCQDRTPDTAYLGREGQIRCAHLMRRVSPVGQSGTSRPSGCQRIGCSTTNRLRVNEISVGFPQITGVRRRFWRTTRTRPPPLRFHPGFCA